MERALILVSTGTLTIERARNTGKGKSIALPRTLNFTTGKVSMRQIGFSDAAWGKATCSYATSIHSFSKVKFDTIITAAGAFMKATRAHNRSCDAEVIDVDEDNERACIVESSDSDSDVECNVLFFFLPSHHWQPR